MIFVLQILLVFIFLYLGVCKAYLDEQTLISRGQTGVEGLPSWLNSCIGWVEIVGATALVLPLFLDICKLCVPLAALGLGLIMIPAAVIHFQRNEHKNVILNCVIGCLAALVAHNFWQGL